MKRNYNLDCLRGFTALYVMICHATYQLSFWIPAFGQDAVTLFFILSGFVIALTTETSAPKLTFKTFFLKRLLRIYPIYFIGLTLAWFSVSLMERRLFPVETRNLLGNLLFLQDLKLAKPGVWFDVLFNPNLWTLSYEWFFYIFYYALYRFVNVRKQALIVFWGSLFSTIIYGFVPNQICLFLSYFILFWLGVELSREYLASKTITWKNQRKMFQLVLCVAMVWLLQVFQHWYQGKLPSPGLYPILPLRHFVSALISLSVGVTWVGFRLKYFNWIFAIFHPLAPVAYGIYVFQWPVLYYSRSTTGGTTVVMLIASCLVVILLAWLAERKLQPYVIKFSRAWLKQSPDVNKGHNLTLPLSEAKNV